MSEPTRSRLAKALGEVVTKAEMREAGIAAGIPADVVDKMLGRGLVLVDEPYKHLTLRLVVDDNDEINRGSFRRIGTFTDPISGQVCIVMFPTAGGLPGIDHPNCATLADLSIELDAFYCPTCQMNGRISGAWCADLIAEATR